MKIIEHAMIEKQYVCTYCGDKTTKYFKGFILFGRWVFSLYRISEEKAILIREGD